MSYAFIRGEAVVAGFRRIANQQLQHAIQALSNRDDEEADAIHQARKRFKKLRGLIRLFRPGFDEYREVNLQIRDAGRVLSRIRDAESVVESVKRLIRQTSDHESQWTKLQEYLEERTLRVREEWTDLDECRRSLARELEHFQARIPRWKVRGDQVKILFEGMQDYYRRAARAMRTAHASPTDANLHEWRKRSKDHWYHMRLLKEIWNTVMDVRCKACEKLCDLLGEDHDLTVLSSLLEEQRDQLPGELHPPDLIGLMLVQRAKLQRAAGACGRLLFAEQPKAIRRRLEGYWTVWREEDCEVCPQ